MRRTRVRNLTILPLLVAGLLLAPPLAWSKKKKREKPPRPEEVMNLYLGVEYSQWLVGATYFIATPEERAQFLALTVDEEAAAFVAEFWKSRDPDPLMFGNEALSLFEERTAVADRRFREQTVVGRRTHRGMIYVLFGEPSRIEFDTTTNPRDPELEVWTYPKQAPAGLSGSPPERRYYFAEKNGSTVLHVPRANRRSMIKE